MFNDLSLNQVLFRLLAMILLVGLHGFALAGIARLMGDKGPSRDGRLTANPFVHLDLLGLVGAVTYRMGWIKPIAIDPTQLRWGRVGLVVCVLASLLAPVLFGMLLIELRWLAVVLSDPAMSNYVVLAMTTLADCAVWFAVFNLIPLPPLTGAHLLAAIAPAAARAAQPYTLWISLALVAIIVLTKGAWLRPIAETLTRTLLG